MKGWILLADNKCFIEIITKAKIIKCKIVLAEFMFYLTLAFLFVVYFYSPIRESSSENLPIRLSSQTIFV